MYGILTSVCAVFNFHGLQDASLAAAFPEMALEAPLKRETIGGYRDMMTPDLLEMQAQVSKLESDTATKPELANPV